MCAHVDICTPQRTNTLALEICAYMAFNCWYCYSESWLLPMALPSGHAQLPITLLDWLVEVDSPLLCKGLVDAALSACCSQYQVSNRHRMRVVFECLCSVLRTCMYFLTIWSKNCSVKCNVCIFKTARPLAINGHSDVW